MLTTALDRRLMLERHGLGPPRSVALHGWGRNRLDWNPVLQGLPAYALDLPGFGLSPPPPHAWGALDYARFLDPLFDGLEPCVLVGHSFGGRVALHLAAHRPDRFRGVVLTGTPVFRLAPAAQVRFRFRLARALHRRGLLGDRRMEDARNRYGSADYRAASGVMREVLVKVVAEEYVEALEGVRAPIALVWGQNDSVVPLEVAHRVRAIVPSAELDVVSGSGHLLDAAMANRIRERILAFS